MAFDVDDQSAAVASMAVHWPMIDALIGGTAAMRAARTTYMPKWPAESDDVYKSRIETATLFPAFSHTATVMAAKPLSKAIGFETEPSQAMKEWLGDVDMTGTNLHAFSAQLMTACMEYGLIGVLVEYPTIEGAKTRADEQAAGARPYLTIYPAATILGWRAGRSAEGNVLTQIRLLEHVTVEDGDFGEKTIKQVRVLTPGAWQIWRKNANPDGNKEEWVLFSEGRTSLTKIPFVFFYGIRKSFGVGAPPLLDLAYLNVEHWQSSSDQQTILHVARVPILFAKGFGEGDTLVVGAGSAVTSISVEADLKYVEHTGAAIEAGRQAVVDLEDRMRQTGAELLVQRPATTTATQTVSEGEGSRSILQRIVEIFEESLSECLELMAEWVGEKYEPGITMFKDFGAANLSDQTGDLLLRAADGGHVSSQTVFKQLQRMDIVDPNLTWDDEQLVLAQSAKATTEPEE